MPLLLLTLTLALTLALALALTLTLTLTLTVTLTRSGAKPIVALLTDGEQTVWGLNHAAMEASDELKNAGADIIAMSLGTFPRVALRVP